MKKKTKKKIVLALAILLLPIMLIEALIVFIISNVSIFILRFKNRKLVGERLCTIVQPLGITQYTVEVYNAIKHKGMWYSEIPYAHIKMEPMKNGRVRYTIMANVAMVDSGYMKQMVAHEVGHLATLQVAMGRKALQRELMADAFAVGILGESEILDMLQYLRKEYLKRGIFVTQLNRRIRRIRRKIKEG